MTKHKHLTLSDRNDIQLGLERGETFKAIGQSILKDPTTVSKEVKRNRQVRESTCHNLPCPLLDKAPFVCNGCPKRRQNCGYQKILYLAKQAQKQYEQTLVEAREGTPLNSKTFWDMDKVISDGVKKGQHIYHILKTHNLDVSSSTVYRHIRKGYLSIAPIDLARAVKFKERRKSKLPSIPKEAKEGRSYEDFQNYLSLNQLNSWLEMDTVMGRMGGKVLLTFNLSFCNFIFARLLDNKTALRLPNTSMILRTPFMKLIKISSNSFLSSSQIMVESLPGLMISKWMCEERVNSSFVTLIALTKKGELRKITR